MIYKKNDENNSFNPDKAKNQLILIKKINKYVLKQFLRI